MKTLLTLFLILISIHCYTQKINSLEPVQDNETLHPGESIIYGNFIQRLGFSSGGFPQDIRIVNSETNETYAFRVKPTYKTAKENPFCFHIKPGKYYIRDYWWTESKWYGGKIYTEPIFKGVDASDFYEERVASGELIPEALERYTFIIEENTINYLGTWHFNKGLVSFSDDKPALDPSLQEAFPSLDFTQAVTNLPK